LAIERPAGLGLVPSTQVFAAGGGASGNVWLRIRATINKRYYIVPERPESAVGAAILAAAPHVGSYATAAGKFAEFAKTDDILELKFTRTQNQ